MLWPAPSRAPLRAVALTSLLLSLQPLAALAAAKSETKPPAQTAQQKESPTVTRLGGAQGWDAYSDTEKGRKICYLVGAPGKSEPNDAKRGKVSASISHRPTEKVSDEVSFNAGYLFKEGSAAELTVDSKKFTLFTSKDSAWARDAATDKAIVAALAKGKQAVIKGTSARGTVTTDTYTLAGLNQALMQIDKACGVKH